jgi:transitional endoplasmic reticulum ATPase
MSEEKKSKKRQFKEVGVSFSGTQIVLPEGMDFDEGIKWLERRKIEDEREVVIDERVDAFPLDGAFAFHKAISQKYGFSGLVPTPGFFGPKPPAMVGVAVDVDETVQVPWGRLQIPGIDGYLQTLVNHKDGRQVFVIGGVIRQKHKKEVAELAKMTREIVKKESIYRGKAIKITFPELDSNDFDPTSHQPKFLDTRNVAEEELIFSEDVAVLVRDSLFTPIERTDQCRKFKIPLKRGILLEGPYGTGKTLTAYVTAKKAVENGWTFIYLNSVRELQQAIFFAQQYGPAVIFAEDIDQVLKGDRDDEMNQVLNTIDGIDTKSSEVIVVLTTNHVENINPAMLRPGRLDAVVPVRPPDSEAVTRLIKLYARGLISENEDLSEVSTLLHGHIPAVIREVVERSKLSAVSRLKSGEELSLTRQDLVIAAKSMKAQVALINPNQTPTPHPMQVLGEAMGREVAFGLVATTMGIDELTKAIPPEVIASTMKTSALKNGNGKLK